MSYTKLIEQFISIYGGDSSGIRIFEAPGRVNLIGEHTDTNGGYVLPAALTMSNVVVARKRDDDRIRLAVSSLPDRVDADISRLNEYRDLPWGNYQLGMAWAMQEAGYEIPGCDLFYHGTVPYGGGLSSSASIEVVMGIALVSLNGQNPDLIEIAKLARKAENEYCSMNCGIMDQFASAMGKKDHAILLDCNSLQYKYVPLRLGDNELMIIHTNKPHKLTDGQYNSRVAQSRAALKALRSRFPDLPNLCHLSIDDLESSRDLLTDETLYRRARHCTTENSRTLQAAECLNKNDLESFGKLMRESHISLRYDYEVTGPELDAIYDSAYELPGVLGVRMTGGGFGGCAIALVRKDKAADIEKEISRRYEAKIGYAPIFYHSQIGDGGREIVL